MPKTPPTEWARLQMFESLAAEFFEVNEALHFPGLGDSLSDEQASFYWLQFMRSMMLRKFYAPDDQVQLPRIAKALRLCSITSDPGLEDAAKAIEQQFDKFGDADAQSWKTLLSSGTSDAFEDMIYGRLLHADSDKFLRTEAMQMRDKRLALFIGGAPLQAAVELALFNVRVCVHNGWVADPTI